MGQEQPLHICLFAIWAVTTETVGATQAKRKSTRPWPFLCKFKINISISLIAVTNIVVGKGAIRFNTRREFLCVLDSIFPVIGAGLLTSYGKKAKKVNSPSAVKIFDSCTHSSDLIALTRVVGFLLVYTRFVISNLPYICVSNGISYLPSNHVFPFSIDTVVTLLFCRKLFTLPGRSQEIKK